LFLVQGRCGAGRGFGRGAPDDQQFADHLHRRAGERSAERFHQTRALLAIVTQHPDLDQLMVAECAIDFREDRGRQTGVTDHDNRIKVVGLGPQFASLGRCKRGSGCGCTVFWHIRGIGVRPPGGPVGLHATLSCSKNPFIQYPMLQPQ